MRENSQEGLIAELRQALIEANDSFLKALKRENERSAKKILEQSDRADAAEAKIKELKAEIDRLSAGHGGIDWKAKSQALEKTISILEEIMHKDHADKELVEAKEKYLDLEAHGIGRTEILGKQLEAAEAKLLVAEREKTDLEMTCMHLRHELDSAIASMEGCHRMAEAGVPSLKEAHRNTLFRAKGVVATSLVRPCDDSKEAKLFLKLLDAIRALRAEEKPPQIVGMASVIRLVDIFDIVDQIEAARKESSDARK